MRNLNQITEEINDASIVSFMQTVRKTEYLNKTFKK